MAEPGKPGAVVGARKKDPGPFAEKDTDLGKFSHGNFDVEYQPKAAKVQVTLKLAFDFADDAPIKDRQEFIDSMRKAVGIWDRTNVFLRTTNPEAMNPIIRFGFQMLHVTTGEHKTVDTTTWFDRPFVAIDLNMKLKYKNKWATMAHELGHIFGNCDEYPTGDGCAGWFESIMWWRDNDHLDDLNALMNSGYNFNPPVIEFRKRYFNHFQKWVNEHFEDLGIRYELEQSEFPVTVPESAPTWPPQVDAMDERNGIRDGYVPAHRGPGRQPGATRKGSTANRGRWRSTLMH
jgi:hypothetical protein